MEIFYRIFLYFVQSVPCIIWNQKQQEKLGGKGLDFQILNHFQTSLFIGKCMENGKNSLILAQKREYHGIFSTEFFLSLICVRYQPKNLLSSEKKNRGYGP